MKKLVFLIAFLLSISSGVYADTYAIQKEDGTISILYYGQNSSKTLEQAIQDAGMSGLPYIAVSSVPDDRTARECWRILDNTIIVDETCKQEHDFQDIINSFDVVKFQSGLLSLVSGLSNINLRFEFAAINAFATNKDFQGIRDYLLFLIQNNIATEGDYNLVNEVLKTQSIDLDNLPNGID